MKKIQILSNEDVKQKTIRIAHQVVENNYEEKELILVGIKPNGFTYAQQLKKEIEAIDNTKVSLLSLTLNKQNPLQSEIKLESNVSLNDKSVIIVDDVANTGKTLYYALKPIMEFSPRKVQAVVLVDRQHKLFPVTADFIGLSLSTTLQEHIQVEFDEKKQSTAYLI